MIVTKDSNIKEVLDYHELEEDKMLHLAFLLQTHKAIEIKGFGYMATYIPLEGNEVIK
ncbi:hypothetical protein [Tissierella sp. P1]|uniref:hypothetical protein n=1 Tax=Tissierella sp. P1 TaxID=1280483 RepID=UPI0013032E07|nr:hypothetical protein [Tissierella sp. P1]